MEKPMKTTEPCGQKDAGALEFDRDQVVTEFKRSKSGEITGYGAVFGNIDRGADIIAPGAFADSLKMNPRVKMLWQHDPYTPIGVWDETTEDEKGLKVRGRLLQDVEAAREATALVNAGAIDGLSIGYRTLKAHNEDFEGRSVRVITKAELWEVSLVTFPMNPQATIDAVKAAGMTKREFERQLLRDSKLSRQVAGALMRDGWKGVQALSDSGENDLEELMAGLLVSHFQKQQILRS